VAPELRGPTRGDRRRRAILDAVEELLRDRSIAELSVEDIASAAGITRSGFYFYFDTKYAALGALLAGVWEEMARAAAPFLEGSEQPPAQYVRGALRDVGAAWRTHEHLLVAMADAAASDPGARELWEAWIDRFSEIAAERIDAERAAGRAPGGPPDAWALARVLLAMNVGAFYRDSRRRARGVERESTVEALAGIWLAAVWGERLDRGP
jgi:AcrR family transcriptional regulator